MNTPLPPDDHDLDALLAEDSELIRRYRALPQSEPGKHLDTAILGRAGNSVRRSVPRPRWLIPVASAASIVAAAGIGWRVHLAQQQEQAATMSAARDYEVLEIDLQGSDKRRALDTAGMPRQAPKQDQARGEAAATASAPAAAALEKRPSLSEIIEGPARDNGVVVIEPHTSNDHAVPGRVPEQREPLSDPYGSGAIDARGGRAPPMSTAAPAPAEAKREEMEELRVTGSRMRREDADAGYDDLASEREQMSPVDWIDYIRDLISARRSREARDEVERFRDAYPSYRLPPDLRRYDR